MHQMQDARCRIHAVGAAFQPRSFPSGRRLQLFILNPESCILNPAPETGIDHRASSIEHPASSIEHLPLLQLPLKRV
jgi:hypothetical protein